jgi:hypothetical protein
VSTGAGGGTIATRRTTSSKRDRERAKQARAQAKRERRAERSSKHDEATASPLDDGATAAEVIQQLKELHDAFDQGTIAFDDFDAQKTQLLDRIASGFDDPSDPT